MGLTLTEFRTAVYERTGLISTDTLVTTTVLDRLINRGLQRVAIEADWPWLQVADTWAIDAASEVSPTGLLRIVSLVHSDTGEPLARHPVRLLHRVPTTITGRPTLYGIFAGSVHFRYAPSGAFTLNRLYVKNEPTLAGAGTSLVPEEFSQGVVEWVSAKALTLKRDFDRAQEAKADYKAWVLAARDNINQGREPLRVTPRPGGAL